MGLAAAKLFVREEGASVLAIDINEGNLEEAAAIGIAVSPFVADVAQEAEIEQAMAAAAERFGGIDIVCANAGIFPATPAAVEVCFHRYLQSGYDRQCDRCTDYHRTCHSLPGAARWR